MLKIDKTGVSTSKRVYFRMFLPSLASVMAVRPCFCSFLLFVVEVPANFVETAKRAITCSVATSHIGLEFLTKFLNMSKLQNRLILLYQSLPLHYILLSLRPVFFLCDIFCFHQSPPQFFTRNETFCERRGLLRVFGTMRLTEDIHQLNFRPLIIFSPVGLMRAFSIFAQKTYNFFSKQFSFG